MYIEEGNLNTFELCNPPKYESTYNVYAFTMSILNYIT